MSELFYVLDIGDAIGDLFSKVLQKNWANAFGHLISFAFNATLWLVFIHLAATAI